MTPIPVDRLFNDMPKLFAYELPSFSERESAGVGDMVKLFVQLEECKRPRPIWFVVTDVKNQNNIKTFTAKSDSRYSQEKQQRLGQVQFDASHIYRLPVNRPETENATFDVEFRDEKCISA